MTSESKKYILFLDDYGVSLRYKNMTTDPSPEESRIAIARVKYIMHEFSKNDTISEFMNEANEVRTKILKASYEKYSDVDISTDKPDN